MGVRHWAGLYAAYFRLGLKTVAQYRADFALVIAGAVFRDGAGLLFLGLLFGRIPALAGWSLDELLLAYGLLTASGYLGSIFLNAVHGLGWYVQAGGYDVFLIRPAPPLFQLIGEQPFNITFIGNFLVGLGTIGVALGRLGLPFRPWWLLYFPAAIVSGALLGFSLNLIVACCTFRFTSVSSLLIILGHAPEFARFPPAIYAAPVAFTLTWLLPHMMTGIYPAAFLLGRADYARYGLLAPASGWLFLALALLVWRITSRWYTSTGT
jgi:ABC-2 type transport system permease protein